MSCDEKWGITNGFKINDLVSQTKKTNNNNNKIESITLRFENTDHRFSYPFNTFKMESNARYKSKCTRNRPAKKLAYIFLNSLGKMQHTLFYDLFISFILKLLFFIHPQKKIMNKKIQISNHFIISIYVCTVVGRAMIACAQTQTLSSERIPCQSTDLRREKKSTTYSSTEWQQEYQTSHHQLQQQCKQFWMNRFFFPPVCLCMSV